LACGSTELEASLDLGHQTPANNLQSLSATVEPERFPLGLNCCRDCWHGQLSYAVPPQALFSEYLYKSGTSETLDRYFDWFCTAAAGYLPNGGAVLEIGANDGTLLAKFAAAGLDATGIDPAKNIVREHGGGPGRMICDFFPSPELADQQFDLIVGLNVLAHTPEPVQLLEGVKKHLSPGGVAIFQTSQATMLANGEFDTIYHEHYSFFTPGSLSRAALRAGLSHIATRLSDIHGTSFLFFLAKGDLDVTPDKRFTTGRFAVDSGVTDRAIGGLQGDLTTVYSTFAKTATARMGEVREIIGRAREEGVQVVMVGAAAKAVTFARAAGLEFDAAYDEAPEKQGLSIPGLGTKIQFLTDTRELAGRVLFVLTAWNFSAELERKVRDAAVCCEPQFLVYFPEVKLW